MRKQALLTVVLSATACSVLGLDGRTLRQYEVAAHKAGCVGLGPTLCLQVREAGETTYQNMFETPIGFDYEWGFEYLISVYEEELDPGPADGSSIRRTLDRIVSKTAVPAGSIFELLVAPEVLRPTEDSRYALFSGPEVIECSTGPSCSDLSALVALGVRILLVLEFPAVSGGSFAVVGWTACSTVFGPCVAA